jgi:hypothetical protein
MAEQLAFENETRDRLNRMECELRRWRRGAGIVLSAVVVAIAGAMADPPANELKVRTLRVVDREGKDRVVLTAEPKVPDMIFFDPGGKSRLSLDIADDHTPILQFSAAEGEKGRLTLGIEEGAPLLQIYDRSGRKRVMFGVPMARGPVLRVLDETERLQSRFP